MAGKLLTAIKCTLIAVNIIFMITAIMLMTIGLAVDTLYQEYYKFLPATIDNVYPFCYGIIIGAVMFLLAVAGFCNTLTEHWLVKMSFFGTMVIMFIFQLAISLAALRTLGDLVGIVQDRMAMTMELYGHNFNVTKQWDLVQQNFECCGATNPSDWLIVLNTEQTVGLPLSCCSHVYGTVHSLDCSVDIAYLAGCADQLVSSVSSQVGNVGVAGVSMSIMQALVILGALWMMIITRGAKGNQMDSESVDVPHSTVHVKQSVK